MQNHLKGKINPCMFLSSRGFSIGGYVSAAPIEEHRPLSKEDQVLEETVRELSLSIRKSLVLTNSQPVNARDIVLRKCGQTDPLLFTECYPET